MFHAVSDTTVEDVEKFIQTVCYPGIEEESFTEKRVRLYKQKKIKTSMSLLLKEKSILEAIKFVHHQAFYASRVDEIIISDIFCKIMVGLSTKRIKKFVHYVSMIYTFLISFLHFHSSQQI